MSASIRYGINPLHSEQGFTLARGEILKGANHPDAHPHGRFVVKPCSSNIPVQAASTRRNPFQTAVAAPETRTLK